MYRIASIKDFFFPDTLTEECTVSLKGKGFFFGGGRGVVDAHALIYIPKINTFCSILKIRETRSGTICWQKTLLIKM